MRRAIAFVLVVQVFAFLAVSQVPKPVSLKPDVALKLRDAQYEQAKLLLQMKQLEAQYKDMQQRFNEVQAKFIAAAGTALKDSGIDETKYVLNQDTLEVTPKPAPAAAEPKNP